MATNSTTIPTTTPEPSTPTVSLPSTSSEPPPPPPPSSEPTTSSSTPTTPTTTTRPPPTTSSTTVIPTTTVKSSTITTDEGNGPTTKTEVTTVTAIPSGPATETTGGPSTSTTSGAPAINLNETGSGGLSNGGRIAIAVIVPIVGVALLVLAGIYLWRKRKQRKDAEEQRRKEVEDYAYNPNTDPTVPAVAGAGYEMKEDASGYRGWGSTTLASSTGRKASTTMSGGAAGVAYSDATSPTRVAVSDTRSGEPLVHNGSPPSPEGEILGAMGPSASNNRGGDVHRGLSNASSSYSGAARSDTSGDNAIGVAYGSGSAQYYDQYGNGNPYADGGYAAGQPGPGGPDTGSPVIRDVTARRNTRIESPSHYPQQSVGISQNF